MAAQQNLQIPADDDDYNSASDEDFNPDAHPTHPDADAGSSSSASEEDEPAATRQRKRKDIAQHPDFDNSGDEATITKAKRKKRRADPAGHENHDDGAQGGFVRTRAQRRADVLQKKPVIQAEKASVDVNALWQQMSAPQKPATQHLPLPSPPQTEPCSTPAIPPVKLPEPPPTPDSYPNPSSTADDESTITIKRTFEFAGETMQQDKVVPASSAEAKLYLQEQASKDTPAPNPHLRRPKKRASIFDGPLSSSAVQDKGPKLNTLQKSKLDWAAHVDQEGISDELNEHRRAKGGYLGRMDFLGRMDNKREEDLRALRPK